MAQVTIREVAHEAGVSVATASDVLRLDTRYTYRSETVTRVSETARRLGYEANGAASLLRQKKSNLVGLAVDINATYLHSLVQVAYNELSARGYTPVQIEPRLALEAGSRPVFPSLKLLCGVLSIDAKIAGQVPDFYREIQQKVPVVALYPVDNQRIDYVATDRARAVELAVEHLVGLGHSRILYFLTSGDGITNRLKVSGWKSALLKFPIHPYEPQRLPPDASLLQQGQAIANALEAMEPRPTAIINGGDDVTIAALGELQRRNWQVPQQISLVSSGLSNLGELTFPSLTSVVTPAKQIVAAAADRLQERIAAAAAGKALAPLHQYFEPELIVRESSVAPLSET